MTKQEIASEQAQRPRTNESPEVRPLRTHHSVSTINDSNDPEERK
jgi:hypothetical protein